MTGRAAAHWVRFIDGGKACFGTLEGDRIRVCEGDMFGGALPTERMFALAVETAGVGKLANRFD